jgi:hypothetical protein
MMDEIPVERVPCDPLGDYISVDYVMSLVRQLPGGCED